MTGPDQRWPAAADYAAAVQDPETCLRHPRLRSATFQLNRMGLPVVKSGQTAAVFPIETDQGPAAVRFFTVPVHHADRYEHLARHLTARPCDLFVAAEWLPDAVAYGRGTYPAVVMPWVPGSTLSSFLDDAVDRGEVAALSQLAADWVGAAHRLAASGIVHGDLQHGNVLVDQDLTVRLIDYDGSWVAGLPDELSELGHPNFQHPERLNGHRATPNTDVFSAFVIFVSLRAIAEEPALWEKFHCGENLIFSQDDFAEAGRRGTPVWDAIAACASPDTASHADTLARLCGVRIDDIPSFDQLLTDGAGALRGAAKFVPERAGRESGGAWWSDSVELPTPSDAGRTGPTTSLVSASSPVTGPPPQRSIPTQSVAVDPSKRDAGLRRIAFVMTLLALVAAVAAALILVLR